VARGRGRRLLCGSRVAIRSDQSVGFVWVAAAARRFPASACRSRSWPDWTASRAPPRSNPGSLRPAATRRRTRAATPVATRLSSPVRTLLQVGGRVQQPRASHSPAIAQQAAFVTSAEPPWQRLTRDLCCRLPSAGAVWRPPSAVPARRSAVPARRSAIPTSRCVPGPWHSLALAPALALALQPLRPPWFPHSRWTLHTHAPPLFTHLGYAPAPGYPPAPGGYPPPAGAGPPLPAPRCTGDARQR
jgi:hypothetical protein